MKFSGFLLALLLSVSSLGADDFAQHFSIDAHTVGGWVSKMDVWRTSPGTGETISTGQMVLEVTVHNLSGQPADVDVLVSFMAPSGAEMGHTIGHFRFTNERELKAPRGIADHDRATDGSRLDRISLNFRHADG